MTDTTTLAVSPKKVLKDGTVFTFDLKVQYPKGFGISVLVLLGEQGLDHIASALIDLAYGLDDHSVMLFRDDQNNPYFANRENLTGEKSTVSFDLDVEMKNGLTAPLHLTIEFPKDHAVTTVGAIYGLTTLQDEITQELLRTGDSSVIVNAIL